MSSHAKNSAARGDCARSDSRDRREHGRLQRGRRKDGLAFDLRGDTISSGIYRRIVESYRRRNPGTRINHTYADAFGFFRRLYQADYGTFMAASCLTAAPVIPLFLIAQKPFVQCIATAGGNARRETLCRTR
ncbi:hypothetical protein OG496_10860 [Streptomyces sp. NBC_00988]|uniref:hypothetical protein n=1 Tax=Streptomyces sp. NBC_00988 TaxID=2903704 RepID=UPI00386E6035|nr:hypothetical protein OG496_10860 [Streptomyces sp. NBC_00988]